MLISRALKSLVDGISTFSAKLKNRKYVVELENFNIVDGSGLHRRPPAETIKLNIDSFLQTNPGASMWVKEFTMYDEQYFLVAMWLGGTNKLLVINTLGVATTITQTAPMSFSYLETTSDNIAVTINGSTLYVVNKTKTITTENTSRGTPQHSFIRVVKAPEYGSTLIIRWIRTGTPKVATVVVANSPFIERTATDLIALQIASAIAKVDYHGTKTFVRGSIIFFDTATDVTVTDDADGEVLQVSNDKVDTLLKLPKYNYAPDGVTSLRTIHVESDNENKLEMYMLATPIADASPATYTKDFSITAGTGVDGTTAYTGYNNHVGVPIFGTISTPFVKNGTTLDQVMISHESTTDTWKLHIAGLTDYNEHTDIIQITVYVPSTQVYIHNLVLLPKTLGSSAFSFETEISGGLGFANGVVYDIFINQREAGTPQTMEEVVWRETSDPTENYKLNASTMPHLVSNTAGAWDVKEIDWDEKTAGNNNNNPQPYFVGKTINDLKIFQNRLVALIDDLINTTETDNLFSWWRNTTHQLLPTHPVRLYSTVKDSSKFHSALNHDKDLLIFSATKQFKLPGSVPLTPNSGLPMTTTYSNLTTVRPFSLGTKVYFPFLYSPTTAGIAKYIPTEDTDNRDKAINITDHVKGFIPNNVTSLIGDANVGTLIATTFGNSDLYMLDFDEITQGVSELRTRKAWHKWTISGIGDTSTILEATYHDARVTLLMLRDDNTLDMIQIAMTDSPEVDQKIVHLDYTADSTSTANAVTFANYVVPDNGAIVTFKDTAHAEHGRSLQYTKISDTQILINASEVIPDTTEILIGIPYEIVLSPGTQYIRDQGGKINSKTRLTVQQYLVHLENSANLTASLDTQLLDKLDDQHWSGLTVGGFATFSNTVASESGLFKVAVGERSDLATLRLHSNSHLPMNITDIEFIGSYSSRGRRF